MSAGEQPAFCTYELVGTFNSSHTSNTEQFFEKAIDTGVA
jgi:hypothetical protein